MSDSDAVGTEDWYRGFAEIEAAGSSPHYQSIAGAIADDADLIKRIRTLPIEKRQPNLLLAAAKFLDAPLHDPTAWIQFVRDHWTSVEPIVMHRWTQTNEAARTATLLPLLAQLAGPIALVEVGASAGLCLYPDQYRIVYDQTTSVGPRGSPVEIHVATSGPMPVPSRMPEIRQRIGIDRNPLDVSNDEDVRWLRACIWPEHTERLSRLDAAVQVVAADPPELIRGDLVDEIGRCLERIPADVTPVVFHSAVLSYIDPAARQAFAEILRCSPRTMWLSNEGPGVVEGLQTDLTPPVEAASAAYFLVGVNGEKVEAIADPHGAWLRWRG